MREKKVYSARLKVSLITFAILLVQVFIFYLVYSKIDVFDMLENSTYRYYTRRLEQSAENLENQMVHLLSSGKARSHLLDDLQYYYLIKQEDINTFKINEKIAFDLLETQSNTGASGALLLLNSNLQDSSKDDVFFIRDTNTEFELKDHTDIMLEVGSEKIAKKLNLTLNSTWKPKLNIGKHKSENIQKIKEKIREDFKTSGILDQDKLSFWVGNVDLMDDGNENLVFVQPLIDRHSKTIYGVLMLELNRERISSILEVHTLPSDFSSGFAILQKKGTEQKTLEDSAILVGYFGDFVENITNERAIHFQKVENKYYSKSSDSKTMYRLNDENGKQNSSNMYGLPKKIRLYDMDSVYAQEEFYLVLFLDESNFYYNQSEYKRGVLISVLVSIFFALILSIILSSYLTKPIRVLVHEIENIDISKKIVFKGTRIKEMDLLAGKIEGLSKDIGNFYFKMQNMLEMLGKAVVILEEDTKNEKIYRTGRISAILGCLDPNEEVVEELSKANFDEVLNKHLEETKIENIDFSEEDDTSIIRILKGAEDVYLKYEKKVFEGRNFHIYMDYTEEYNNIVNLEKEKNYDFLTSLPNRSYFKELVMEHIKKKPHGTYAMIMWDLDNLKYINDMFGHDIGDTYLKETAKVISSLKGDAVFLSRFSGDEFFAFIEYKNDKEEVRNKLAVLQNKLLNRKLSVKNFDGIRIRASVGVSWYPEDADNYYDLYKYTDFAMYQAKHSNKGTIVEFDKKVYEKENIVIVGKEDFNILIEQKLVKFAFQPIVSVNTGEIFGYEALMRSQSDSINSIEKIMKIAKLQFKLPQIESLTFEGVFDAIKENEVFIKDKRIFINSIASVGLPEEKEMGIREKLAKYSDQIVVEITENEEVNNEALALKKEYRHKYGTMMAIDDFGSGYSTETSLLKINPDFIKIDMVIIKDIHKDRNRYQLVKNIIEYSKIRGIKIIAEGVETEEELYALIELGADFIQGYYLAKPSFDIVDISDDKKEKILSIRDDIILNKQKMW